MRSDIGERGTSWAGLLDVCPSVGHIEEERLVPRSVSASGAFDVSDYTPAVDVAHLTRAISHLHLVDGRAERRLSQHIHAVPKEMANGSRLCHKWCCRYEASVMLSMKRVKSAQSQSQLSPFFRNGASVRRPQTAD